MERAGFVAIEFGPKVDTFAGAPGEANARSFGSFGVAIRGRRPTE